MIKNSLFAVALLSLALAGGCAKGGNGSVPPPVSVDVEITSPSNLSPGAIYPTQTMTLTATVTNSTSTAVTWSLAGPGTLTPVTPPTTPATATYVAPSAPGSATVTATLVSDSAVAGPLTLNTVDITTDVAPATVSVGIGDTQQFTAIAVPDDAPQNFSWTCTVVSSGAPCNTFLQDPNVSGLASYTAAAADNCPNNGTNCIQVSAVTPLDTNGCATAKNCTAAKVSVVPSRVSGTYAFRFSGYDTSNHATAVAGTFTVATNGAISGTEEELTSSGSASHTITAGAYTSVPINANTSENNAGTLILTTAASTNTYRAVLNGDGDIAMIEIDGAGTGSGIAQKSASSNLFTGTQTFAFGLTGVDSSGNRVGYVGVLPMTGSGGTGTITGGQMDAHDSNGNSVCGGSPCSITTGSYTADPNISGLWHLTLTTTLTMKFDFFFASGTANKSNPLTCFVITDPADTANPAVSGTMVLQDSTQTYNNAAFNGISVSALTGIIAQNGTTNSNVSLTLGNTDGNGNFSGQFDQNNGGTILSSVSFPPATGNNNYTYAATGTNGRYTFNMLGNPNANPVVAPLPFVLYASGANRGFLLDTSSSSVMTGTINPQGPGSGAFANSELRGTYAAATTSGAEPAVDAIAANLLLTPTNTGTCTAQCVNGTLYDSANTTGETIAGANPSYAILNIGTGTMALTTPSSNYVIYVQDTSGCAGQGLVCGILDFLMIDVDSSNPNPSIIFAQQ